MILKLKTAPTVEPLSIDEVKAFLRVDHCDDDFLLTSYIKAARQRTEKFCGPLISQTWYQYEEEFPSGQYLYIGLPRLVSVTALKYTDSAGTQSTFSATEYTVYTEDEYHPAIVIKDLYSWPGDALFNVKPIEIEFVCGYGAAASSVDEDLLIAIRYLISHWYEFREPLISGTGSLMSVPDTYYDLIEQFRVRR